MPWCLLKDTRESSRRRHHYAEMAAVSDEGGHSFGLLRTDISCSETIDAVGYKHGKCCPDPPGPGLRGRQLLPLGEIKSLYKVLEQQGYAVPQEADDLLEDVVSNSRQNRSQSPCPFVAAGSALQALSLRRVGSVRYVPLRIVRAVERRFGRADAITTGVTQITTQ
ncbi:hypothetical protein EVAR_58240_1 [Eumeta japonica]|uniref:Uncharacterized protein n=1 Tax=Eumeta variegata TaxID=151549 RepID=A0A4C2AGY5_EUMVA|nr:hypothetical protein EVAR_58240_1 [Eumeta japonica]